MLQNLVDDLLTHPVVIVVVVKMVALVVGEALFGVVVPVVVETKEV